MSVVNTLLKLGVFSRLLNLSRQAENTLVQQNGIRETLNKRLESVTRATLNGETEWFLQLVRKDPECAIKVIEECDLDE